MNDLYVTYFDNIEKPLFNEYFAWQEVVKKDLRIICLLVSDYEENKVQKQLLGILKGVIDDLERNCLPEMAETPMELNIKVYDNYLVFSYYHFIMEGRVAETPSIVIISRDMKNLYFIDEVYSVFYEDRENDEYNLGQDEVCYFKLNKDKIGKYDCCFQEYTHCLFDECFRYTLGFVKMVEKKGIENAFLIEFEKMYNEVCSLINRDYKSYYDGKYVDDEWEYSDKQAYGDKNVDITKILKSMVYMLWNCWDYVEKFPKEEMYMVFNVVELAKAKDIRYAENIYFASEYQTLVRKYTNSR